MSRTSLARAALAAGLLATTLVAGAGCLTWRPAPATLPAAQAVTAARGRPVRLTTRASGRVELRGPRVIGDSVIGETPAREPDIVKARAAVALADVTAVQVRRVSVGRTALALVGGTLVTAIGAVASSGPISLSQ
jgi:hypothetical protein